MMTGRRGQLTVVRGAGDTTTGTIHRLRHCDYPVLVLETGFPSAIRRCVALSGAVYDGTAEVEGITCVKRAGYEEACVVLERGNVLTMIDETCRTPEQVRSWALVDAILAKENLGTTRDMANKTIRLGPGFITGQDVDFVIETMRGHNLGKVIGNGTVEPSTGIPGAIDGFGAEHVIHSPARGIFFGRALTGDVMEKKQRIGTIATGQGEVSVEASLTGLLRGIIKDGYPVVEEFETVNVDPGEGEYENCFIISDKARCIAGSVLEGLQILGME